MNEISRSIASGGESGVNPRNEFAQRTTIRGGKPAAPSMNEFSRSIAPSGGENPQHEIDSHRPISAAAYEQEPRSGGCAVSPGCKPRVQVLPNPQAAAAATRSNRHDQSFATDCERRLKTRGTQQNTMFTGQTPQPANKSRAAAAAMLARGASPGNKCYQTRKPRQRRHDFTAGGKNSLPRTVRVELAFRPASKPFNFLLPSEL